MEGLGSFAFEARKVSGSQWGFAAGLDLSAGQPSKVPGLSAISRFEKAFRLQKLMLVMSSFENANFQFPDLAQFNNPLINAKKLSLPSQANGVTAGLNIFGEWALDTKNKQHNLLRKLLRLHPTLGVTLQVGENPEKNAKLFVRYDTKLNGHPFEVEFGGMVQSGEIGLFLTGTATVKIQKQPQTFDVNMIFVENGAFISADMKGPSAVHFGAFKLSELALEIGVDWEGVPSLGIAATIDGANFDSSIAIFFDSADPAKSLVAGAVSDLTLKDVVDTLAGKAVPSAIDPFPRPSTRCSTRSGSRGRTSSRSPGNLAQELDHLQFDKVSAAFQSQGGARIPASSSRLHLVVGSKGSVWYLTDLTTMRHYQLKKKGSQIVVSVEAQFYCAPQATSIGTIRFPQGFYINAALEFLGFEASATININANKGVAIDAQMDKIVIGNEFLFCIKEDKGKGGPKVSAATFSQPKQPVKAFRSPHFYINGKLEMLGLSEGIFITLSEKGFEFDLNGHLLPGVFFEVKGYFAGPKHLGVSGTVKVGLGTINLGPIGKIHINSDAEGTVGIEVHGNTITATLKANFEVAGKKHRIGTFHLDVKGKALAQLPETLLKEAEQVLREFFGKALKDVENAQKQVNKLNGDIAHVRRTIQKNRAKNIKKLNDAQKKISGAERNVNKINKQIHNAKDKIKRAQKAIHDKKKWASHGNFFQKASRGLAFAAFATAKNAEIVANTTAIGADETAKGIAHEALEVAKLPLKGLVAATKVTPIDMDPRIVALFTARDTATAALTAAKAPLKALAK